ncbi:hypothetical protein SEPCBS119000_003250 [Sporothrix epigloea]|uniref:Signal peptide peptidase n=1 Tax=Sporothrix epigloea TaxID=1892477 RepID=A0ABP0DKL2_9PEZI
MAAAGPLESALADGSLGYVVENVTKNLTEALAASIGPSDLAAGETSALSAARAAFSFSDPSSLGQLLYAYRHVILMEGRILALALGVIYVGAHASLTRPHSAAPREDDEEGSRKKKKRAGKKAKEGLRLSDALLMPLFAAGALMGMYYLIEYMQDPALLNRIIRAYTSLVALASVGSFLGDGLNLVSSLVFPNVWTSHDGRLYRVDGARRVQWVQSTEASPPPSRAAGAAAASAAAATTWEKDASRTTPFPDLLATPLRWLPASTATSIAAVSWSVRRLVRESWSIHVLLRGVGAEEIEGLSIHALVGLGLSAVVVYVDYFLGLSPALLNNVMGLGLTYFALQVVSLTSFGIGSTVLLGLFLYDIVMVFYTPFMVKVATTVEAPIKIVAASGGQSGMLGLGDIVVPGLYICMCLRYDLYRHYARQVRQVETSLTTTAQTGDYEMTAETMSTTTAATRHVKSPYIDPQGRWGDRLWTRTATPTTPGLSAARFAKPYFVTSMVAYVVGLTGAMLAMVISRQGQPALFYLVPALLLATWGRAALAGHLPDMWAYTEDSSLDTKDVVVDLDADGMPIKQGGGDEKDKKEKLGADPEGAGNEQDFFVFAIRAPPDADSDELDI